MSDKKQTRTVGSHSYELQQKSHDIDHSPNEQMAEQLKDYDKNMEECVARSKKDFDGDFYVVVITKKERLMQNVIRNFFTGRKSCPTPEYDQSVYTYDRKLGHIKLLWVVPSKDTCFYMIQNALTLPSDQRVLLEFVMDFADNTLLRKAKELNGEKDDSPLLINA